MEGGDWEGDGRWRRRREELLADELMAQVEWKEMCLDIRGMIVAWSDDMGPSRWLKMPPQRPTGLFLWPRKCGQTSKFLRCLRRILYFSHVENGGEKWGS